MKKHTLPRRSLTLWQIRAGLVAFLVSFLLSLTLSDHPILYPVLMVLTGVTFLFFFCIYFPLKRLKLVYFIFQGNLVVDSGVFYNRRRIIPLDNIQYVTTLQTPDMFPFSFRSVIIHSVGTSLYLPCLPSEDALNLQEYCARRKLNG